MHKQFRMPGRERAQEISERYGAVARVRYHSGSGPTVINRIGIAPAIYVNDPNLKRGLVDTMEAVDLHMGHVEGYPDFDVDYPLLDAIFEAWSAK